MLLGEGLVGVNHRAILTSTQRMTIKEILHAPNLLDNGSPYMHAMGLINLKTSISQIHNYSTSMTLISPSSYLKTIIKNQTSHSIQFTFYGSFIISPLDSHHIRINFITKANYHAVLKTLKII